VTISISGTTRVAAVFGWPVDHSRSPQIHNAAFAADGVDAVMVPIGVPPEGFAAAVAGLHAMRALGASVTVPHKLEAAALCDELTAEAQAIGAVNCIQFGERMIGHNTDSAGFVDGLVAAGFDPRDKRVVLLGAGGSARAVAYGLRAAHEVAVIARRPETVTWATARLWTDDQLRTSLAAADLVIDCTSVGLDPAGDTLADAVPLDALAPAGWVAALVYHRRTSLLERASAAGHSTLDGRAMLVHQAARAYKIWTGLPAPVEVMTRALDASLAR
jgi:shikimate dehydrogenase